MATINQLISALNVNADLADLVKHQLNEALEVVTYVDDENYLDEESNYLEDEKEEYPHTYVSYFCWEETNKKVEQLFEELDDCLKAKILDELNLPDYLPHPWFGGKGLIKLLREVSRDTGKIYIYLLKEIGWTLDNLRKLKNPVILAKNSRRNWKQKDFLSKHHINVQLKLLEKENKDFQFNGETYTKSSEDIFEELVETWYWIFDFDPTSIKGIRVRDIFSYYEELKKLKIQLEPSYALPIDEVLKAKIGDSFEGYSVVFPTESRDLKWWGEKLNHCVGGYGEAVLRKACSIISLNKEDIPIYTIEIRKTEKGYNVPQFMGYKNSPAPEELVEKFKQLLQ
jgi:hypothetical protein